MTEHYKLEDAKPSDQLEKPSPAQIQKDKSIDFLRVDELEKAWFIKAKRASCVPNKKQVSLRIDEDILEFFKEQGSRYQTKMHAVLRAYVDACRNRNTG
jgi:uncharacterized protein (DUF4415 family)